MHPLFDIFLVSASSRSFRLNDKTVAASLRNARGGGRGSTKEFCRSDHLFPSWKTLISAKSANYFECVPDRVRIKIRSDRFWPGGPQERFRMPRLIGPLASRRWIPIQRRTRSKHSNSSRRRRISSCRINATSFILSRVRIWLGTKFEIQKLSMAFCLLQSNITREKKISPDVYTSPRFIRNSVPTNLSIVFGTNLGYSSRPRKSNATTFAFISLFSQT